MPAEDDVRVYMQAHPEENPMNYDENNIYSGPVYGPRWEPPRGARVRAGTLDEILAQLSCGDCDKYHSPYATSCCPDATWSPSCCGGGGFTGDFHVVGPKGAK